MSLCDPSLLQCPVVTLPFPFCFSHIFLFLLFFLKYRHSSNFFFFFASKFEFRTLTLSILPLPLLPLLSYLLCAFHLLETAVSFVAGSFLYFIRLLSTPPQRELSSSSSPFRSSNKNAHIFLDAVLHHG